jgi:hypothetical protein
MNAIASTARTANNTITQPSPIAVFKAGKTKLEF